MKVALFSNAINHHQLPFALAMNSIPGVDYVYISTRPMSKERISMGWLKYQDYDFVLNAYESKEKQKQAVQIARTADIVLVGAAPMSYVDERLRAGKIVFRSIERLFKQGTGRKAFPKNILRVIKHRLWLYQGANLYFLASSAYLSSDLNLYSNYRNKVFRWGYFTECKDLSYDDLLQKRSQHKKIVILWAARFLELKHPEVPIMVAKYLKEKQYQFTLRMIGDGDFKSDLIKMVHDYNLDDVVSFLGLLAPNHVREQMEDADIFLFTSDFNEGWGAVLNESMSSGCSVVSTHSCGAAPFLIKDGLNGFLYRNGNQDEINSKVEYLLNNPNKRQEMGLQAFKYIRETWSPKVAANRLLALPESFKDGKQLTLFHDGPCSPAPILKDDWY